ncbi:MAG: electron transfer flavoprotein subunit alpha/FixB family protein [Bacteroidetes bacterium]|nr:electron transfer flavoprotein subunit alpha/FixB family protein [Bacteroidota bacterium]
MSVLVYTENWDGKFKKLSFELVSYGFALAKQLNTTATVVSVGNVTENELNVLGNYGASKIINVTHEKIAGLDSQAFTSIIAQVAQKEGSTAIVMAHNFTGKTLAPRLSVKLKAGLVSGAVGLPHNTEPFTIRKRSFNGNAFANVIVRTPVRIVTLLQNSYGIFENPSAGSIENFTPELNDNDFKTTVKEVDKVTGQVLLTDAEIVVSAGRGMKGPENWKPVEELASVLGAAVACSRPVSDEGWRPHHEHVGQTGKIIAPNLYLAIGISGAIQHLGGVSGSKCIVAVNRDPEAPIFETADYGIVGDAFKVLPELIAAVKELKAG